MEKLTNSQKASAYWKERREREKNRRELISSITSRTGENPNDNQTQKGYNDIFNALEIVPLTN